jgi:hypothetical protein
MSETVTITSKNKPVKRRDGEIYTGTGTISNYLNIADEHKFTDEELLLSILDIDGTGSELDADLLDGEHGSFYAPIDSPTFTGIVNIPAGAIIQSGREDLLINDDLLYIGKNGSDDNYSGFVLQGVSLSDMFIGRAASSDDLIIAQCNDETYHSELFRFTHDGKLGIGFSSPDAKVSINGGLHIGGEADPGDNNMLVDGWVKSDTLQSAITYVTGFAGEGYKLEENSGISTLEVDDMIVRRSLKAYELEIREISSVGGSLIISAANTTVYNINGTNLYFDTDGGNNPIPFTVDDYIRSQIWTGRGTASYLGKVTAVHQSNTLGQAYVETITISGTPWVGMKIVQAGNYSDTDRQNLIYLSASEPNNPFIDGLAGVNAGIFSGKQVFRLGNLQGITDPIYGELSGYGLFSSNVYLTGWIKADSGYIGGWTIDSDAIFTGTKKTSAGYTTDGITMASNGSLRAQYFEIRSDGKAQFESVDSIFKSKTAGAGDLTGSVVHTQVNIVAQAQIDTITITPASGGSGTANIYCNGCVHEIAWNTNRALSISNFASAYTADWLNNYGVDLTSNTSQIIFTAHVPGVPFSNPTYIQNTSPNIDGNVVNTQPNITGQKRIDTVTLSSYDNEGEADLLCDGLTKRSYFNDSPTQTAADFVICYATDWLSGGVVVTSDGEDIIFTSQTAGVDFTGNTTITNIPLTDIGSIKIQGNNIWENDINGVSGALQINYKGYAGSYSKYRALRIGNGRGSVIARFYGDPDGTQENSIRFQNAKVIIENLPTSSSGCTTGQLYKDGSGADKTLKIH